MKKLTLLSLLFVSLLLAGCGNKVITPNTDTANQPTDTAPTNDDNEAVDDTNDVDADDTDSMDANDEDTAPIPTNGKKAGTGYTTYNEAIVTDALASGKKVALFFHASRCPTCIALNENIETNFTTIPEDTIIFKVDYDTSDDLKETYGVTTQHTLVYIDQNMDQVNKVVGPTNLEEVLAGFPN
jgi:thiol-disulfide isomerase/thioredoxin